MVSATEGLNVGMILPSCGQLQKWRMACFTLTAGLVYQSCKSPYSRLLNLSAFPFHVLRSFRPENLWHAVGLDLVLENRVLARTTALRLWTRCLLVNVRLLNAVLASLEEHWGKHNVLVFQPKS